MTHDFDIDCNLRQEEAKESGTYTSIQKCYKLYELASESYHEDVLRGLIDPKKYAPTCETNECEAAIFAIAWFVNSGTLLKRFGENGIVSLFDRFRCSTILDGVPEGTETLEVFRGTRRSPGIDFDRAMSWTTSYQWAEKFAKGNRYANPVILTGRVETKDILMAVHNDEENEIVVRPRTVIIDNIEDIENS